MTDVRVRLTKIGEKVDMNAREKRHWRPTTGDTGIRGIFCMEPEVGEENRKAEVSYVRSFLVCGSP